MPKSEPWFPNKDLTYGQLYFYMKGRTLSINPFDKATIAEAKYLILREARDASPNYKLFIKAATLATSLSERSITKILYKENN